jgi:hypothetical protein
LRQRHSQNVIFPEDAEKRLTRFRPLRVQAFSHVESNDAEIETLREVRSLNLSTGPCSIGDTFEARAQSQFGFLHAVAGFPSVKGRKRGIGETAPGTADSFL